MTRKSLYVAIGAALAVFALSTTAAQDDFLTQQLSLSDGGEPSTQGTGASGPAGRPAESMELGVDKDFESDRGLSDGGPTPLPE